jgi:protein phosphatase
LFPNFSSLAEYLEPIVVTGQGTAGFADVAVFSRGAFVANHGELGGSVDASQKKMILFLAQLLYTMTSGKRQNLRRAPLDYSDVPAPFRNLVSRAAGDKYPNLAGLLEDLVAVEHVPGPRRGLRQIAGYGTDVGRQRDHNEDFVGKYSLGLGQSPEAPEVGLYLVADGMGGHQSGELASREVARVILEEIQDGIQKLQSIPKLKRATVLIDQDVSPGDVLRQAVQRANEILYNASRQVGSDRGTTLTAALIVGEICAIANVGDSRTYLWRKGHLEQITQDHSLVASLVAANMIPPEQVRDHPQRSQIYRNLGERPSVEVDIYERILEVNDRLLLCSDGLWEMCLDQEIRAIVQASSNPQDACDQLVAAANLAGGEDNISAIMVWIA